MSTFMTHDPDGPGVPAFATKRKEIERVPRKKKPVTFCTYNEGVMCDTYQCDYCGFNPDRKEKPKTEVVEEPVAEIIPFCDRMCALVEERGVSKFQFEIDTGIARRIFYKQTRAITRSTLMACAYYLGITVEELVEGTNSMAFCYER